MMTAILDLSPAQQTEVRRLLTAEATEMRSIADQADRDARHTAMRALHERTKASIRTLLNPTQRATMDRVDAVREAHRDGRGEHRGSPAGAQPAPTPGATR